jgi:N-methylhydantoinase A
MILGILNPEYFVGGRFKVNRDLSLQAADPIAKHVGLGVIETAEGIFRIVNANMAAAIRQITVERGIDPRAFTLISFGGAGGQHAVAVAKEIGIAEIMLPNMASVFSAFGMVTADMRHTRSRTLMLPLTEPALEEATVIFEGMEREAIALLEMEKAVESVSVHRTVEVRYEKQAHEIAVDLSPNDRVDDVYRRFENTHRELYGTALGHSVMLVTLRSTVIGAVPKVTLERHQPATNREAPVLRHVTVHPNPVPIPVLRRPSLEVCTFLSPL